MNLIFNSSIPVDFADLKVFNGISGVYCIENTTNGKKYVGSSNNVRARLVVHRRHLRDMCHYNEHLQRSWNRDGEDSFRCLVLEEFSGSDYDLRQREQVHIDMNNVLDRDHGYNVAPKTDRSEVSEETRQKQSRYRKGRPLSPKHAEAVRLGRIGCKASDIGCKNMSDAQKRRKYQPSHEHMVRMNQLRTQFTSEATREKIRQSKLGRSGYKPPLTSCDKMRDRSPKRVLCIETGVVFKSRKDAANWIDRLPCSITMAINRNGICSGYHWRSYE